LLLVGIRTSKKRVSERHPFGYGKEQFFWAFLVSVLIFGIYGILSLERGIESILAHELHSLENVLLNYVILAISFVFEGHGLRAAILVFKNTIEQRGDKFSLFAMVREIRESEDSTVITVFVENAADMVGLLIATIALILSGITGNMAYDSIGSLIIGLELMAFAVFLAKENKDLLIGESISKRDYKMNSAIVFKIPEVNKIISIRSMHLAPEDVLIAIDEALADNLDTDRIESVIDNIESKIRDVIPYAIPSKISVELERSGRLNKKDMGSTI